MTANFTLSGITKVQRAFLIDMYQKYNGVFTMELARKLYNVRTSFALQLKRVILWNHDTGLYYFNSGHAVAIREKLESWGVELRPYAVDFGAWFDAYLGYDPRTPKIEEPAHDESDTQIIEPLQSVTPAAAPDRCPDCGRVACVCDGESTSWMGGGGGYEIDDDTRAAFQRATARANARLEFDHAKSALVDAQKFYNAARGYALIGALEMLKSAQERYERAAADFSALVGGGGGGDYAPCAPIERFFESPRQRYEDGYRMARIMRNGASALSLAQSLLTNYVRDRSANVGIQHGMNRPSYISWRGFQDPYQWLSKDREHRFRGSFRDEIPF